MIFWGWIPILTKKVLFEYFIDQLEQNGWEKVSEDEKESIRYILKTNEIRCYRYYDSEDKNGKKFKAIVCINNYKIIHVFMHDSEDNIKAHAECAIHDDGIVEIKLDSDESSTKIAKRIYILIRDIYHSHTHHGMYDDLLLKPVIADNKKEAIEKILNQYEKKIIEYHRVIKEDIEKQKDFPEAIKQITKFNGEMTYALAFTKLTKLHNQEHEIYNSIFSNSIQSINVLAKETELIYNNSLSRSLNGLTIAILVLTFPIAIDAIYKISEKIMMNPILTQTIIIVYVLFLLFVAFKLKSFLLQEMKLLYHTAINIFPKFYQPIAFVLIILLIIILILISSPSAKQSLIDFIQAAK